MVPLSWQTLEYQLACLIREIDNVPEIHLLGLHAGTFSALVMPCSVGICRYILDRISD